MKANLSLIAFASILAIHAPDTAAQARAPLAPASSQNLVPLLGFTIKYASPAAARAASSSSNPHIASLPYAPLEIKPSSNPLISSFVLKHNPSSTATPSNPVLLPQATLSSIISSLKADANIVSVSPNIVMKPLALSNPTPASPAQWHFIPASQGHIDISSSWQYAPEPSSQNAYKPLVAVIDTGYIDHPDILSKIVGQWDFVGNDNDAHDTGDSSSSASPSTWHGTKVSGAISTNLINTAGVNFHSRLLHARTLGPGGGSSENVANAIRWAAGIPVPGTTPHGQGPADIINLSLGADATSDIPCSDDFKDAIAAARAAGSTIVVASGNSGYSHIGTPSNCPGVIAVGASTFNGDAAFYSNLGSGLSLLAPGGDYSQQFVTSGVSSGSDEHSPIPSVSSSTMGTSFAAPVVSGSISLLKTIFPSTPSQAIADTLLTSTKKFPAGTFCTLLNNQNSCGAGLLSVDSALSKLLSSSGAALSISTNASSYFPGSSISVSVSHHPSSSLSISSSDPDAPTPVQSGSSFSIPFPSNLPSGQSKSFSYTIRALSPSSDLSSSFSITASAFQPPLLEQPDSPIVLSTSTNSPTSINLSSLISDPDGDFDSLQVQTSDSKPLYHHGISVNGSTISWANPINADVTLTVFAKDKTNLLSSNSISIALRPSALPSQSITPAPTPSSSGGGGSSSLLLSLLALLPLLSRKK